MTSVRTEARDVVAALSRRARTTFVAKPFHAGELRARVRTGARRLERLIALGRITELQRPAA